MTGSRIRGLPPRPLARCGLLALLLGAVNALSMPGLEGSFEYAIDAPWRMEPVVDASGRASYGAIPILLTVLDANVINFDAPSDRQLGNFCDLVVDDGRSRRRLNFSNLAEVEMTGRAGAKVEVGSWTRNRPPPPHATCLPATGACAAFLSPHGTSEWYATAWYTPAPALVAGGDLNLKLTARFTRNPRIACTSPRRSDYLLLTNHVSVHAGEAPLPRFRDNRWAYGDLHFHGQGTDNEGEAGYSYRGVIRAMGAMGLDFVYATEHASDSDQILDVDFEAFTLEVLNGDLTSHHGTVLRDMNAARFEFLHGQLWGPGGANRAAAIDGRSAGGAVARPQNVAGHGAAPQIFLGGELDVMAELPANFPSTGSFPFGDGQVFQLSNLCGGWTATGKTCPQAETVRQHEGVTILQDVQGFNAMHPARAHMVYLPRDGGDAGAFVASRTGITGGGGRHLTLGDGVLTEMEAPGEPLQKGFAFLAHPVPMGRCVGGTVDLSGGAGPDAVPYTGTMLDQAFESRAVLGLEFWNEDIRMLNKADHGTIEVRQAPGPNGPMTFQIAHPPAPGTTREIGFHTLGKDEGFERIRNSEPQGFVSGDFEMIPWVGLTGPRYAQSCTGVEWMLHQGLRQWDDLLMRGLVPSQTAALAWLPTGDPRRLFAAGGSDAHGDLNYHRAGYMRGLDSIDDMAIGKPRNLVMAGAPAVLLAAAQGTVQPAVKAFSQEQVLKGIRNGAFAVTDGPALRIAIDKNGNGVIDDADSPMGSIVEMYGDKLLPLIVEWDSTREWGPVQQIELVIGAVRADEPSFTATFAAVANGPRAMAAAAESGPPRPAGGGRLIQAHADGYSTVSSGRPGVLDPTSGMLRFNPLSLSGRRRIDLPLALFSVGDKGDGKSIVPDRLYIRAFARSQPMVGNTGQCAVDPKGGKCFLRYALSNPVWAISPAVAAGSCPIDRPRAIDSDGDGKPNGCDPCPNTKQPRCDVAPPVNIGNTATP